MVETRGASADATATFQRAAGMVIDNPEQFGDAPVDVQLKAGQFSMHSDQLLHGSEANDSNRRRCGLTIRYAAADVKAWFGWDQKGIVVKGEDRNGNWLNAPIPPV